MVNGIEESKLSKTRHIQVQPIPGAKISDIKENLTDLLHKELETVIIHAGTNDSVADTPQNILNNLLSLKKEIETSIPKCQVIISKIIKRTDNSKANSVNQNVNRLMKESKIRCIDNDNIMDKHLGKRGLHLNQQGNVIFASNLLNAIRNP